MLASAAIVAALLSAWSQWQPERSEDAREEALALLASSPRRALTAAETAVSRDPLSVEALFTLAQVQELATGRPAALQTLRKAVRLQPSNPQTWLTLGRFQLNSDPKAALGELRASIYLDPASISPEAIAAGRREAIAIYNEYVQALRAVAAFQPSPQGAAGKATAPASQRSTTSTGTAAARQQTTTPPRSGSAQPPQAATDPKALTRRRALEALKRFQSQSRKAAP